MATAFLPYRPRKSVKMFRNCYSGDYKGKDDQDMLNRRWVRKKTEMKEQIKREMRGKKARLSSVSSS